MKLTVLSDNNTIIDEYYVGEPAVSYYIECEDKKILFDVGYSDVYLQNAKALNIDLSKVDTIVLSHAHDDHTKGLGIYPYPSKNLRLIAHPLIFEPREYCGLDVSIHMPREEVEKNFNLDLISGPVEIAKNLFYLGEIERSNNFENKEPIGYRIHNGEKMPDFLVDDTALAYVGKKGLSIISACSHSGICNIIEYAKKVTGVSKVYSVIGGFHMFKSEVQRIKHTADYFANQNIPALYPCHCTCFEARAAIHYRTPVNEIGSGTVLEWE